MELSQLRLLQVILETRNLTRTAERAGLTQSAVSQTLKKLRHAFNDALVIRQGNRLVLTPRAESIQIPLNRWLNEFERNILFQEPFDPKTSDRTFYIATSDMVEQIVAPPLIRRLKDAAPTVHLSFSKLNKLSFANQIESGEVDFCVSVLESNHPSLMVTTLYRDDFVSLVRNDHPYLQSPQDIESFCSYPHILAGTGRDARGTVDDVLESQGFSRVVQFKVANFSSAPYILEASNSILTAPRKFAKTVAGKFAVAEIETPFKHKEYSMRLYWHIKNKDDEGNRWLRKQFADIAAHI
ncbi:MAG: LysR family transcriptional regulator [Pseudomonadota bacterium]